MTDDTELDAIVDALGRLRGRGRPPFGPFARPGHRPEERGDHGGHRGHGAPFGHGPRGTDSPHPRLGGGPARFRLLDTLAAASHPLSVSEVGEAIGVDQPRASRLIQQAVELGLVQREADPDDARRTRVALTAQGRRIAQGFRGERRERVRTALEGFSDAERIELARLLAKLADAWPET